MNLGADATSFTCAPKQEFSKFYFSSSIAWIIVSVVNCQWCWTGLPVIIFFFLKKKKVPIKISRFMFFFFLCLSDIVILKINSFPLFLISKSYTASSIAWFFQNIYFKFKQTNPHIQWFSRNSCMWRLCSSERSIASFSFYPH